MRSLLLAAVAACLVSPASATTVSIGFQDISATPLPPPMVIAQAVNPVNGTVSVPSMTNGIWTFDVTATAFATNTLGSTVHVSVDPSAPAGRMMNIYVTISDITAPVGQVLFTNAMTAIFPSPGVHMHNTTYSDDSAEQDGGNGVFSLTRYLNPPTGLIFTPGTNVYTATDDISPGLYSMTQVYTFYSEQQVAVPGPIAGAGLPGLAMLLAGAWLRWRRRHDTGRDQGRSTGAA